MKERDKINEAGKQGQRNADEASYRSDYDFKQVNDPGLPEIASYSDRDEKMAADYEKNIDNSSLSWDEKRQYAKNR